jgi:parvulin-like peptidyl-prolyl isomerase
MRNGKVWGTCLAIIVFVWGASAQQSATPPKTAEAGSSPAAKAETTATPPAGASAQKVVLRVGSTQVTEAEIDAVVSNLGPKAKAIVATQGRRPVGEEYLKMLLLSQRATDEHLDSSPAIRSQPELQRAQTLAQAEYQQMASEVQITEEDVSRYFTAQRSEFETVQVREFLIRKRPPGTEDPKQGLPIQEAKTTAESIRKALLAGTDVDEVAQTFATSISVMLIDRKPRTLRRSEMKPALEKASFDLPDGGVSEVVDTPEAFIVVKVLGHQRPELKEVAKEIESRLRQQRLDVEVDDLKKKAGVWMDEDYFKAKPVVKPASPAP